MLYLYVFDLTLVICYIIICSYFDIITLYSVCYNLYIIICSYFDIITLYSVCYNLYIIICSYFDIITLYSVCYNLYIIICSYFDIITLYSTMVVMFFICLISPQWYETAGWDGFVLSTDHTGDAGWPGPSIYRDHLRRLVSVCVPHTEEDNNRQVCVTEGGVNVAMSSLSTQTDTTVVIYILIMLSFIAIYHPRELLHETHINTLMGLLHHDQQRISYMSCLVLVHILISGPSSWTGIDVGKVKSSMMTVMSGWRMEEDMGWGVESDLTWVKTHLSNNHPAVQYHTAWEVCYHVTRDPDIYCPIVARDIGLNYLAKWLLSKKSCTEARGLIQTVIDVCKKHHKK